MILSVVHHVLGKNLKKLFILSLCESNLRPSVYQHRCSHLLSYRRLGGAKDIKPGSCDKHLACTASTAAVSASGSFSFIITAKNSTSSRYVGCLKSIFSQVKCLTVYFN